MSNINIRAGEAKHNAKTTYEDEGEDAFLDFGWPMIEAHDSSHPMSMYFTDPYWRAQLGEITASRKFSSEMKGLAPMVASLNLRTDITEEKPSFASTDMFFDDILYEETGELFHDDPFLSSGGCNSSCEVMTGPDCTKEPASDVFIPGSQHDDWVDWVEDIDCRSSFASTSQDSSDLSVWSEVDQERPALIHGEMAHLVVSLAEFIVTWYTAPYGNSGANRAAHSNMSQSRSATAASSSGSSSISTYKRHCGDDSFRQNDQDPNEDGDEDQRRRKYPDAWLSTGRPKPRLLACPFSKHDPIMYRKCYKYVLKDTAKLKQHLSRCHKMPLYCPRCSIRFDSEQARDEHIRDDPCEKTSLTKFEGISEAQRKQLEQRVSSKKTIEQNWYEIYKILFPLDQLPNSPWLPEVLDQELVALQDLLLTQVPILISKQVAQVPGMCNTTMRTMIEQAFPSVISLLFEKWEALKDSHYPSEDPKDFSPPESSSDGRALQHNAIAANDLWHTSWLSGPSQINADWPLQVKPPTSAPRPIPGATDPRSISSWDLCDSLGQLSSDSSLDLAALHSFDPSLDDLLNIPILYDGSLLVQDHTTSPAP